MKLNDVANDRVQDSGVKGSELTDPDAINSRVFEGPRLRWHVIKTTEDGFEVGRDPEWLEWLERADRLVIRVIATALLALLGLTMVVKETAELVRELRILVHSIEEPLDAETMD